MAYITITTDEGCMTLREGIAPSDMESEFSYTDSKRDHRHMSASS
jgi:hypothetical protein